MKEYEEIMEALVKVLYRLPITCLIIILAIGLDNLIFGLVEASSDTALVVGSIGFVSFLLYLIFSTWRNDYIPVFGRVALICLYLVVAIGLDNIIFHLVDASSELGLTIGSIGFVSLIIYGILQVWLKE